MNKGLKKITVNLPEDVLENVMRITQSGITDTLIQGLKELEKKSKRSALRKLKGKIRFQLNLNETRR